MRVLPASISEENFPKVAKDLSTDSPSSSDESKSYSCSKSATFYGIALFNAVNSIVGAGILGFPSAFLFTGLTTGILFTLVIAALSLCTLWIVITAAKETRATGYEEIMSGLFRHSKCRYLPLIVTQFFLLLYLEGACVVYLTVIYQSVFPVLSSFMEVGVSRFYKAKYWLIFAGAALFEFPLSLLPSTEALGPTSLVSVLGGIYLVVFVFFSFLLSAGNEEMYWETHKFHTKDQLSSFFFFNSKTMFGWYPKLVLAFPIVSFAFQCHGCIVPVYDELRDRFPVNSVKKMMVVLLAAVGIVTTLYLTMGFSGFLVYGADTQDNILLNFPPGSIGANLGRLAIALTAALTYPLQNFTARKVIWSVIQRICVRKKSGNSLKKTNVPKPVPDVLLPSETTSLLGSSEGVNILPLDFEDDVRQSVEDEAQTNESQPMPQFLFFVVTICQFMFNVFVACVLPHLSDAFGYIGGIGCSALMFLLPAVMMAKMETLPCFCCGHPRFARWFIVVCLVVIGLVLGVGGVAGVTMDIVCSSSPKCST